MAGEVRGLLLAGGASSRLGQDKAQLRLPGSALSFAENTRRLLAEAGLPVVVAARDLERAEQLLPGCLAVTDGPGRGPAAALLGAGQVFPGASFLALACDMPAPPALLLRFLAGCEGDWVVPAWNDPDSGEDHLEPLCAVYRPPALTALARRVAAGRLDLRGLAGEPALAIRYVASAELAAFGDSRQMFGNVNRPEDLAALAALRHLAGPPERR